MRPMKELPSDTLLSWIRRRPLSMPVEIWRSRSLAPFLTAEQTSGGALDVLVAAHPDAEAACERVEPFDQRGLRLAGFGALAELGYQGGEGVLGRRPGCLRVLLHRSMSAPNRAGCRLSR